MPESYWFERSFHRCRHDRLLPRADKPPARAAERRKAYKPMPIEERVFIAGAGPVGLVAAANLVRRGVPVTVFEAGAALSEESRASTFHPPTLDMLDEFGAAAPLIAQGLVAPQFQYRTRDGVIATFDFARDRRCDAPSVPPPGEQFKLTRILHERLAGKHRIPHRVRLPRRRRRAGRRGGSRDARAQRRGRTALRPLADRRRRRAQRRAPRARHRICRLHLAGAVSRRLDAVRFPRRDRGLGFGDLSSPIRCAGTFSWKFPACGA